jgi:hypothetical protein
MLCLSALLLGTACGTDDSGNGSKDPGKDEQLLKDEARAASEAAEENGETPPPCPPRWLGDGVCDDFCQGGDADDCTVCTQELRERDDECPDVNDACDPDCIACAAIYIEPDNYCPSPDEDPCAAFQDGDCIGNGDGDGDGGGDGDGDGDGDGVVCIESQYPDNDICEAAVGCEHTDVDCATCTETYPQDGCCDATSICANHDPDCQIGCTQEVKTPDGVCDANFCDPDCEIMCAERGDDDAPVCEDPADCEVHTTNG